MIDETWKSYPDITYTTKINKIEINGNNASVLVDETALATATKLDEDVTVYGELNSSSKGTYLLKKENNICCANKYKLIKTICEYDKNASVEKLKNLSEVKLIDMVANIHATEDFSSSEEVLIKKKDLLNKVVSDDGNILNKLTNEELLSLFNIQLNNK